MLRNVLLKTLRDYRRSLLWWGIGLAAYTTIELLFYPSFRDFPGLEEMVRQLPKEIMALFAGDVASFFSPKGFLHDQLFFLFVPLLFIAFTAAFGGAAISGKKARGTLDLLMTHPIARWQVVLQKFGAMALATLALGGIFWIAMAAVSVAVVMEVSPWRLAQATFSVVLLALAFGSIALALGAYLLNALAPVVEALQPYHTLSPFHWYIGSDPLVQGLNLLHVASLLGLALGALALDLLAFQRRDIAV
ncbi:MAG: hypothetical protein EXR55_06125 [Dehalococcoidia bacterium]|nr:hypothetical protein [Dehalococcoidia bacterium]